MILSTKISNEPVLYQKTTNKLNIIIRMAQLGNDISFIYRWCNLPYSREYWGMHDNLKNLYQYYYTQIENGKLLLLIVAVDNTPVALVEVYQVLSSPINEVYHALPTDYGIHLLMAPYKELLMLKNLKGLSRAVLSSVFELLFSFETVNRIFAEPDSRNTKACRLAEQVGMSFVKQVILPDKQANLYVTTRKDFFMHSSFS